MCAVEIGHWMAGVALLHRDFGGEYRVYSTQPQTIPYLLPRPRQGSIFWEQSNLLPGRKKKDF